MKETLYIILFCLAFAAHADAQIDVSIGGDAVLAGEIETFNLSQKKMLEQQNAIIGLTGEQPAIGAMTDIVNKTADLQKNWNDYLSSFHLVVTIAAQTYGFYQEIDHLLANFKDLTTVIESAPANAFAVALKKNRSKIYGEIITETTGIVNDITKLCFGEGESDAPKMTEKERIELIFGIRPKLKEMNYKLKKLALAIRYTSLADVWSDIQFDAKPSKSKSDIAKRSLQRWSDAADGGIVIKQ